jgi:transcriptional regulator with XRE-family HTH domain
MDKLIKNLTRLRKFFEYSKKDVANYLDIDVKTYKEYEKLTKEISLVKLEKLGNLYGVELYDVIKDNITPIHTCCVEPEDMKSIASFNKIVSNYLKMIEIDKK